MAHLDRMAQLAAVLLLRQQRRKGPKSAGVEFLGRRELPQDRAELLPSSVRPLPRKRSIESPASASTRRLVAKRMAFSEKTKSSGVSSAHVRSSSATGPVIGAVDLDRGELAARIFELARLREPLREEIAAPGLEGPAADADPDHLSIP